MRSDSDAKRLVLRSVRSSGLVRAVRVAAPVIALIGVLNGCADSPDAPGHPSQDVATPTSLDQCNYGPRLHGDGTGIGLDAHWLETRHPWGSSAPVFVCSGVGMAATVTVTAPPGVTVTPTSQPLDPDGPSIIRFEITVPEGGAVGHVAIGAQMNVGIGSGDVASPDIIADGDGWAFAEEPWN
jgi:hypothetical protein